METKFVPFCFVFIFSKFIKMHVAKKIFIAGFASLNCKTGARIEKEKESDCCGWALSPGRPKFNISHQ